MSIFYSVKFALPHSASSASIRLLRKALSYQLQPFQVACLLKSLCKRWSILSSYFHLHALCQVLFLQLPRPQKALALTNDVLLFILTSRARLVQRQRSRYYPQVHPPDEMIIKISPVCFLKMMHHLPSVRHTACHAPARTFSDIYLRSIIYN